MLIVLGAGVIRNPPGTETRTYKRSGAMSLLNPGVSSSTQKDSSAAERQAHRCQEDDNTAQ
jgi:hypothetical protein